MPEQARHEPRNPVPVNNPLNTEPATSKEKRPSKTKAKNVSKKKRRTEQKTFYTERLDKYEVFSASLNAQSVLKFGQLLQGDAPSAEKELQRIIWKGKFKLSIKEEQKSEKLGSEDSFQAVSFI